MVHTFLLQTQQQDDEEHEEGESKVDEEEAAGRSLPPYMLKVANLLGDVRLQNCPSPEGQDELYFTAQWEHDGGGVYDIAKFTQPEVICCTSATCFRTKRSTLTRSLVEYQAAQYNLFADSAGSLAMSQVVP